MSSDSTRGDAAAPRLPRPPRWRFGRVDIRRVALPEPRRVPKGVETVEVSEAVDVHLSGRVDPGDVEWFDSYMPTLRLGNAESSRMEQDDDGVTFTFYPEVDGEVDVRSVEFRAQLGQPFELVGRDEADDALSD